MDINVERVSVKSRNSIVNSKYDLPFEIDCTLPDYCRDVEKLLSTDINPVVCSVSSDDNKVTVEGNNLVTVFYCDKENNISKYESKVPFSKTVELKAPMNTPAISAAAYEGYINCRAVSPRRLDIRGTTQIQLDATSDKEEKIIEKIQLKDVETNIQLFENAECTGQYCKQFTIKDSINSNFKDMEHLSVLRYRISPFINEYKILPDKVILKGTLFIVICCCNEKEKKISTESYKMPFSQIIDCPGIDEDCICDFCAKVINSETVCGNDDESQGKFNISATIYTIITGYRKTQLVGIKDCFCHSCVCTCKSKNINILKPVSQLNSNFTFNESVSVDDFTEIKDACCKIISMEPEYNQNTVKLKLRVILSILGIKNKQLCCVEKTASITLDVCKNIKIDCLCFNPHINIIECSCSDINNGKTEISCSIRVNGIIFDKICINLIDDIKPEPKSKKIIDHDLVIIYYTHSKELIWDIAKKYNTSTENIIKQNHLSGDYVEKGQTLLITPFKPDSLSAE